MTARVVGAPAMPLIAPALRAANLACLGEALDLVKAAGASLVHVDVMDGHFAPEITFGQPVVESLRKSTDLALEVHLLVERPERYVRDFIEAGGDRIVVHPEATAHFHRLLDLTRRHGARVGAALNPATPVAVLNEVLGDLDFVTVLTADLGGDETFVPGTLEKVRACARAREDRRLRFDIQAEGGIGLEQLEAAISAGADILVVGSAIFHYGDPAGRLAELIRRAAVAQPVSKV